MLNKILTLLPLPDQNQDGTYSVYYTTKNRLTGKITTHRDNYRLKDDAINHINYLTNKIK